MKFRRLEFFKNRQILLKKIFFISTKSILFLSLIKFLLSNNNEKNYIFNEKINKKYIKNQNDFCDKQSKNFNYSLYINKIMLVNASYNDIKFNMYVYKEKDGVSSLITSTQSWEKYETDLLVEALEFYTKKYNIKNQDAYIIDVGANIGWYTLVFGKLGFNVLSFEPSNINYFILKKNYCLNKDINTTLINKGLFTKKITCELYAQFENEGNGIVYCDKKYTIPNVFSLKVGEIKLNKLKNYISFLSKNKLILIKIDTEGSEGKAFEGGIAIFKKYHVPFIFMEFTPHLLKDHGTDPIKFLQFFIDNGYKISITGFLSKKYIYPDDDILLKTRGLNIYIVYDKIFE